MKILKRAEQKNFVVDRWAYSYSTLLDLVKQGVIFSFDENYKHKHYESEWDFDANDVFRIYAINCTELKIIYNKEIGCYQTVVITKAGEQIVVNI